MAEVFWNAKGILLFNYIEKGSIINSEYHISIFNQLNKKIRKLRPRLQKKKIIFHQDSSHKSFDYEKDS